ncbi:hypothetical protein HPB50_023874 [Hyalomma asiaticum]|uniref:Uncharacterized protein n=1 Tax=Hyalomma asiaticum TaxID=266040 RepID=A0ACB7T1W5_HYAAI|nr:hypothetical protein HPB50_023874 [Hyalomma asiaticum]
MAPATTPLKHISLKFPRTETSTVVIGDSQSKYLHQYFDPGSQGTPAFISQIGAKIDDVRSLINFVPETANTLMLLVGTNDMASITAEAAFDKYRSMLDYVMKMTPNISKIYATLILPRCTNRRRGNSNLSFVRRCNREASYFNRLLRGFCSRSRKVFFLDHGFQHLPPGRVLAADGLHPSFEGVAVMASHIRELCCKRADNKVSLWCEFVSCYPTHGATQSSPRRCYSQPSPDAKGKSPVPSRRNLREESAQTTPSLGRRYPSRKNPARDNATN